jgi:hypothetical protein
MAEQMEKVEPLKEIFEEMFALLESLETQNIAVLQFLKDEGIARDEKLAPYLERAGNASSVKWRAARARMEHLLTPIPQAAKETAKATAETPKLEKAASETSENKDTAKGNTESEKSSDVNSGHVETGPPKAESADRKSERENQDLRKSKKAKAEDAAGSEDGGSRRVDAKDPERKHA